MAVRGSVCLVSSCKMRSLGLKPVKGGSPPRERRASGIRQVIAGVFVEETERVLTDLAFVRWKVMNNVEVIMI